MDVPGDDVFRTLAWYNRLANEALSSVLAEHEALTALPDTTWYGSVLSVLCHIVISDTVWLRRVWPSQREQPDRLRLEFETVGDLVFPDLPRWVEHRAALDADIERLCEALDTDGLVERIRYTNTKGARFEQPRWQLLLHMFNHETHHRGGISQFLDEHGVDNDVSNLVWYLRESS
jgi:uncharacterized damage-inducible protein DinB